MKWWHNLIVIVVISTALFLGREWFNLQYDAQKAATSAVPWLLSHQSEISDPGVIWILSKINKIYCGNEPHIQTLIQTMFIPLSTDSTLRGYERVLNKDFSHIVSTSSLANNAKHFDDALIPALYCDKSPVLAEHSFNRALELAKGSGYEVTHALLTLEWLKERGCLPKKQDDYIDTLSQRLYLEQSQTTEFSDLFAERVAFLQYSNSDRHIPNEWIRTIINNQERSGGWKTKQAGYIFGANENTHTTALSLWALTQFTHSCPF